MTSVSHGSFTIERIYPVARAKVFTAWADPAAREVWRDDPDFTESPDHVGDGSSYSLDFREGGHERFAGVTPEGTTYRFDAVHHDIVDHQRIVFTYEMAMNDRRSSVSLVTVELSDDQGGTRLVYTESGVFLDALDEPALREEGMTWLMDNLGKYLTRETACQALADPSIEKKS